MMRHMGHCFRKTTVQGKKNRNGIKKEWGEKRAKKKKGRKRERGGEQTSGVCLKRRSDRREANRDEGTRKIRKRGDTKWIQGGGGGNDFSATGR